MRTPAAKTWLLVCCLASGIMQARPAQAQAAVPAQSLYGTWYTYPLGNPNTDSVRHEFRHNASTGKDEMIVSRICQGDYRAVIARAVSPIEVTENTIRVAKTVSASERGELNSVCQVSIEAGVLTYSVSSDGNRISITNPGGTPDMFDLARQDASSESALVPSLYGTWSFPSDGRPRCDSSGQTCLLQHRRQRPGQGSPDHQLLQDHHHGDVASGLGHSSVKRRNHYSGNCFARAAGWPFQLQGDYHRRYLAFCDFCEWRNHDSDQVGR